MIAANDIGTDPTGTQALPNDFGVQVLAGASNNVVGGATAAAGNLIAFNTGPGVDVEGDTSTGNQITANRIFANDVAPTSAPAGGLQFQGSSGVSLPPGLINNAEQNGTLEARFQTTSGGVILGYQATSPWGAAYTDNGWAPVLYVGNDGKLYCGPLGFQVTSNGPVNDGQWHDVALVADRVAQTVTVYLDGQLVGSAAGVIFGNIVGSFNQIGTGYYRQFPGDTPGLVWLQWSD